MDTITYRAVIDGSQIAYLQSVIESYDGIAAVRTMDGPAGIIELWIPPQFEGLVNAIMQDIAPDVRLQTYYKAARRLSD